MTTAIFGQVKRMQHYAVIGGTALALIASIVVLIAIGTGRLGGGNQERGAADRPLLSQGASRGFFAVKQRQLERREDLAGSHREAPISLVTTSPVLERYRQIKQRQLERKERLAGIGRLQPISPVWQPYVQFKQRQLDHLEALGH